MLLGAGNVEKMWSAQLCLGVLTILTMALCVPSTHGDPFLLQENRVLPEREDTNHEDTLLTLLLNKKFAWRRPENIDWELAKKFEELEELEKLKDQLSTEDGPEVAYALESLSASQPKKRGLNQILTESEMKAGNLCLHLKSFQSGRSSCLSMSAADSVGVFFQDPAFKNQPAFGNTASEGLSGLEDEDEPFPKLPCWVLTC